MEWKKLNVFKMRFTTFLQILELFSRSDWSGISHITAPTIVILPANPLFARGQGTSFVVVRPDMFKDMLN